MTDSKARCFGFEGGCDGDLPGEAHEPNCPMAKTDSEVREQFEKAWEKVPQSYPVPMQEWWFMAGYEAGRLAGLEKAAKIADDFDNVLETHIATAIREKK